MFDRYMRVYHNRLFSEPPTYFTRKQRQRLIINSLLSHNSAVSGDIGCFRLSINHVRLQPVRFIVCSRWSHLYNLGERIGRVQNAALVFEQCRFAKTSNVLRLWHGRCVRQSHYCFQSHTDAVRLM